MALCILYGLNEIGFVCVPLLILALALTIMKLPVQSGEGECAVLASVIFSGPHLVGSGSSLLALLTLG